MKPKLSHLNEDHTKMTMFTARPGRATLYMQSPFTAELAPSLRAKQDRAYPAGVHLGLLLNLPDPDGYGAVVLDDEGYMHQAVELAPHSASHLAISRPVRFDVPGRPLVCGLALFDEQGGLVGYGALRSAHAGYPAPTYIEFKAHQILIKRVDR
jgi:hypothetical protein